MKTKTNKEMEQMKALIKTYIALDRELHHIKEFIEDKGYILVLQEKIVLIKKNSLKSSYYPKKEKREEV